MALTEVQIGKGKANLFRGSSSSFKDLDLESLIPLSNSYNHKVKEEKEEKFSIYNPNSEFRCALEIPIYLKIFLNITTIIALVSAVVLYSIYFSYGPESKHLTVLQSKPDELSINESIAQYPGFIFISFTALCIDFDFIGKPFNDKFFYLILVFIFMNYMQFLFQSLFAGCGFADFEGFSIISVFFNTLLCSWLGYFAMKLKVQTGKLNESRSPIKEWFGMMVIFTCYLEICHYLTVNKWQHNQFKWELTNQWSECKLILYLIPIHVYSIGISGSMLITYSLSSTFLGEDFNLESFNNNEVSVMILPIMMTSMLYCLKGLTFILHI